MTHKPDLRDKAGPRTSISDTDVKLAGAREPKAAQPQLGETLVSPDNHKLPEGQATKSN